MDTASLHQPEEDLATRVEFRRGVKDALPTIIALLPFALVLGAQAAQKHLSAAEMAVMAGINFAGGSEFAAVGLWTSPPHLALIFGVTSLVNCRHLLMGATLAPHIQHLPRRKIVPILFFMIDESWAMAMADIKARRAAGRRALFSIRYYFGVILPLYAVWIGATALGAALGPVIGDVRALGFDMAFPAVFLVLMRGMWPGWRQAVPWGASLAVAAATYLLVPGAWYVLTGALAGLAYAYVGAYARADASVDPQAEGAA